MTRIVVVASRFLEAGMIDETRLSQMASRLESHGFSVECIFDPTQWELERSIIQDAADLYFPLTMHSFEQYGFDIRRRNFVAQRTLERHNARFVGSSALVQLLARDKAIVTKQSGIGFETQVLSRQQIENGFEPVWPIEFAATRVIVKPNDMTSSIGISEDCVVDIGDAFARASRLLQDFPLVENALIQPYFDQAREFTVSLLGNVPHPVASVLELHPRRSGTGHKLFTTAEKSTPFKKRSIEFNICEDKFIRKNLIFHSRRLFDWFNMKDYARFDYIYTNRPYLIDLNAMPVLGRSFGMDLVNRLGIELDDLASILIAATARRYTTSGRPMSLPKTFPDLIPEALSDDLSCPLPVDAVPESTIPSDFQPLTHKFTMVDRIGAETDVLFFLKALVHLVKPMYVLETGTYKGATAAAIGEALSAIGCGRLVTIECNPQLAEAARMNLASLPIEVVNTSSLEYMPLHPIDLLFLDSTRPARIHEFHRFKHLLSSRALIVWHDSAPEHEIVHRDITALVTSGELDAVLLPSPRGLTISKIRRSSWQ